LDLDLRRRVFDLVEFVGREFDVGGAEILFEPVQFAGSRDRNDRGLLCEEPGQGDLAGCGALEERLA
jgi:hypothetical protein